MLFEVTHTTDYRYRDPAREAYIEARLTPLDNVRQRVLRHEVRFRPDAPLSNYIDFFGNTVHFYSMTLRHDRLTIWNRVWVETTDVPLPEPVLELSIAEARQIYASLLPQVFDYLEPTDVVEIGGMANEWVKRYLRPELSLKDALAGLNEAVFRKFAYEPGATEISTPVHEVWKLKKGVCQDFAHVMLSVLRTAGIPARYVCGYIESVPPSENSPGLVGAVATHAWVEVFLPGMVWVALDPTNNCWCGPQHITMTFGRDYRDATPIRGTFKGSGEQVLKAQVLVKRIQEMP